MDKYYPQRKSPRLQGYDYAQAGAYFVTLCTHQRTNLFGEITSDGVMLLSEEGQIAQSCWDAIPQHFPGIELDAFVVMPNHVHGILVFDIPKSGHGSAVSLPPKHHEEGFSKPIQGSLSTIIRSYKSIVTRTIRQTQDTEMIVWQGRFYDHVIRNESSLNHIRQYILTNPARWHEDQLYAE
jgi:putative transposase